VTAGTIMHVSKLPLTIWFWAAFLMATHSNGISALQLQSLGSYRTAWMLAAKLRRALVNPEREPLRGVVETDETIIPYRAQNDPGVVPAGRSGGRQDAGRRRGRMIAGIRNSRAEKHIFRHNDPRRPRSIARRNARGPAKACVLRIGLLDGREHRADRRIVRYRR
jgi:hypothetical protein